MGASTTGFQKACKKKTSLSLRGNRRKFSQTFIRKWKEKEPKEGHENLSKEGRGRFEGRDLRPKNLRAAVEKEQSSRRLFSNSGKKPAGEERVITEHCRIHAREMETESWFRATERAFCEDLRSSTKGRLFLERTKKRKLVN